MPSSIPATNNNSLIPTTNSQTSESDISRHSLSRQGTSARIVDYPDSDSGSESEYFSAVSTVVSSSDESDGEGNERKITRRRKPLERNNLEGQSTFIIPAETTAHKNNKTNTFPS